MSTPVRQIDPLADGRQLSSIGRSRIALRRWRRKQVEEKSTALQRRTLTRDVLNRSSMKRGATNTPVLLLIIVLAAIAAIMSYRAFLKRFDSELRTAVQKHLAELFPSAKVYVQRVSKDRSGRVVAEVVRLAAIIDGKPFQVFGAEEVIVQGQLDVADFLKQTIRVEQIELIGVQVDAWPMPDGKWSIECLKPIDTGSKSTPTIVFNDSLIRIRQSTARQAREIVVHGVQAVVETKLIQPDPRSLNAPLQKQVLIKGSAQSSGLLENINVECAIDLASKSVQARGDFAGLQFSPKLLERLPPELTQKLKQFSGLECEASSSYFSVTLAPNTAPEFVCRGRLQSGRLQDPRLPYPLEQISSDFYCRNSLLQLRDMQARSGDARLTFQTDIMGLGLDSPMDIEANVEDLDLDKRLYQSLPPKLQQQWDKLQLRGKVGGKLRLNFDGRTWQPKASFTCKQVIIKPWLFPYEFTQVEGEIQYENGQVTASRLRGRAGGQLVEASISLAQAPAINASIATMNGQPSFQTSQATTQGGQPIGPKIQLAGLQTAGSLNPPGDASSPLPQWVGRLQCRSLGPVAIDEDLLSAMTPAGRTERSGAENFIRSMNLTGSVELVNATFERRDATSPRWHRTIEAHVYDGRLQYEKFRFPIYNIRGAVRNEGDDWVLEGFEGRNDSARIMCTGSWHQVAQGQLPFHLEFVCHTIPIVEDLFQALPSQAKQVWEELQPSGSIDQVVATIQRPFVDAPIDTHIAATENRDANSSGPKSLRLFPRKLPYLLDDVSGQVVYHNGIVTIHRATAQNGATRIDLKGKCSSLPDDKWRAELTWLPNTRFMVDSQFVRAMPQSIQESMHKLDFYGPVSVLGTSQATFGRTPQDFSSSWDCRLAIEDGRLSTGTHLSAMRGTVWVRGTSDHQKLNATGQISMDAMRVLKTPVFNLEGPFAILDSKVYFGSQVQEAVPTSDPNNTPRDLTASALAGTLRMGGWGRLDTGKFDVNAFLENAQLSSLVKDIGIQSRQPDATCNASLKFHGVPWNPQTYRGEGEIHLTDAKLYELPFMMRLFTVASVNANDASAFQRADIGFKLDGDHIPLQVSADGEVLRLRGEGWTNLRRDVELQLYTYVGRRTPIGKVITPIFPESRFATFMTVDVTGSLDNPEMQRRPFPQLGATLQTMFPEVKNENR